MAFVVSKHVVIVRCDLRYYKKDKRKSLANESWTRLFTAAVQIVGGRQLTNHKIFSASQRSSGKKIEIPWTVKSWTGFTFSFCVSNITRRYPGRHAVTGVAWQWILPCVRIFAAWLYPSLRQRVPVSPVSSPSVPGKWLYSSPVSCTSPSVTLSFLMSHCAFPGPSIPHRTAYAPISSPPLEGTAASRWAAAGLWCW